MSHLEKQFEKQLKYVGPIDEKNFTIDGYSGSRPLSEVPEGEREEGFYHETCSCHSERPPKLIALFNSETEQFLYNIVYPKV